MSFSLLTIAKRCQLLTGSYSGATKSCDCSRPSDCHLTERQRCHFGAHPAVADDARRNLNEYYAEAARRLYGVRKS